MFSRPCGTWSFCETYPALRAGLSSAVRLRADSCDFSTRSGDGGRKLKGAAPWGTRDFVTRIALKPGPEAKDKRVSTNFQKVLQGFNRGNVFPERLISHIISLASLVFSFPFRITPNHRHLLPDAVVSPLCARRSPAVPTAHPRLPFTLEHSHAGRSRPFVRLTAPWAKDDSHVPPSRERTCQL
jgi:hypothetical protein